ncbi:MAG: hypothetical protein CL878_02675 [Dehalococcoidia bacterium]|nr:hypothetical protein [Dehalococcoidia bacterium]
MVTDDALAPEVRHWLDMAQRHLLMADWGARGASQLHGLTAHHCHEAVLTALKGYLRWRDQRFRQKHTLVRLVERCETLDGAFAHLRDAAQLLAPYAAERLHSSDFEEPVAVTVGEARRKARSAVEFVLVRLPSQGQGWHTSAGS